MVPATKKHSARQISENISRKPKAKPITPLTTPKMLGHLKLRSRLSADVLRHASSGPTPVRNSSSKPSGMLTLLKNGAPTLMREPVNHSENTGNSVPESTATQATSSTRLLNRKLDSRETSESSWF